MRLQRRKAIRNRPRRERARRPFRLSDLRKSAGASAIDRARLHSGQGQPPLLPRYRKPGFSAAFRTGAMDAPPSLYFPKDTAVETDGFPAQQPPGTPDPHRAIVQNARLNSRTIGSQIIAPHFSRQSSQNARPQIKFSASRNSHLPFFSVCGIIRRCKRPWPSG